MATINVGRVKGSLIYSGAATTDAAIKLEVTTPLDGDTYISTGANNYCFQYNEKNTTWVQKVSLKGVKGDVGAVGAKGDKGDPGPIGPAAGFGTCSATINQSSGQAAVSVTASGPDTAKVFAFNFSGIKGEIGNRGPEGLSGGFGTPTAVVDANVGTPAVSVTTSGPDTAKVFAFNFKNLKGVQGITGPQGMNGPKGDTGAIGPQGPQGDTPVVTASLNNKGELVLNVN